MFATAGQEKRTSPLWGIIIGLAALACYSVPATLSSPNP